MGPPLAPGHKARQRPSISCGCSRNLRADRFFFLGRAMNINAALKRVRVLRLESAQPDDARGDGITARSVGLKNFTCQPPLMENSADRHVVADLFSTAK